MSVNITTAFVNGYRSNVLHLMQQKQSKLEGLVRNESVNAEKEFFERLGKADLVRKTVRHGDTPLIHSDHSRRMLSSYTWEWADLVDKEDKIRLLISPQSEYVRAAAAGARRRKDTEILLAASGNAYSGKDGSTPVALPSGQKVGKDVGGNDSNLNLTKLLTALEILNLNDRDDDEPAYIAVSPKMLTAMLGVTQVQSADYNTIKALVKGEINTFAGFTWIMTNLLETNTAATGKWAIAWLKNGLLLGTGQDITTRISERADKSYAVQPYVCMDIGATRMEDEKIVQIDCIGA